MKCEFKLLNLILVYCDVNMTTLFIVFHSQVVLSHNIIIIDVGWGRGVSLCVCVCACIIVNVCNHKLGTGW